MASVAKGSEARAHRDARRRGRRKATFGEALSLRAPRNPRDMAVRKAQLDAFVRLVPATVLTQLIVAAVLVAAFRDTIDSLMLDCGLAPRAGCVSCASCARCGCVSTDNMRSATHRA